MKYNLYDDIKESTTLRSSQIAVCYNNREITYSELLESADTAADKLKQAGIKDYAKCVLIGSDSAEYLTAALAIIANRAVFVSAGKEISNDDFNTLLKGIDVDFALVEERFLKHLSPDRMCQCESLKVAGKTFIVFKRTGSRNSDCWQFKEINPAFIRFSSGTTGDSKGIVLSHETIRSRTEAANDALKITEKDRVLWLLPMAHHFAVTIMLFLRKGCTIDISVDSVQEEIVEKLLGGKITFVYATPYHYSNMIRAAENIKKREKGKKIKISDSVRMLISTAMPLNKELFAKFANVFGRFLNQAYGIIECGLPFVNTRADSKNGTTVGRYLPKYEVRLALLDENDSSGEILIKGEGFFDAYYDPWCPQDMALSRGGWFHTGDIGRFLPGGYLEIIGRKKSVINFLGLKIFPEKVENILNSHPQVLESRVIGRKHPEFGEIPHAEIIPDDTKQIDEINLMKHCAARLASHEVPQTFETVQEIPRTRSGKIKRR